MTDRLIVAVGLLGILLITVAAWPLGLARFALVMLGLVVVVGAVLAAVDRDANRSATPPDTLT